ncbi:hypothetical protein N7463_000038 [Penicillium fimorum]|uniref:Uncharacterized protein n=1 Tax=Penicillium fimorum TaxID=1882269 RepID=A0A9W9Y3H6_9EURO|nr:hypothetical protein N7463_000038 [Penicillium fimorum]
MIFIDWLRLACRLFPCFGRLPVVDIACPLDSFTLGSSNIAIIVGVCNVFKLGRRRFRFVAGRFSG